MLASLDTPFDYELFNLGNSNMVKLKYFVDLIEMRLGRKAVRELLPIQPGDVHKTNADIEKSTRLLGFRPETGIEDGLRSFFNWFRVYHADMF